MNLATIRSFVDRARGGTHWQLGNKVLYTLCQQHPRHESVDVVLAKVLLIGRAYAAAIERRRVGLDEDNEHFYVERVAPMMMDSRIDDWLDQARSQVLCSTDAIEAMIAIHGRVTDLFAKISGLEKRSLASKYLHFHVPGLFFIYDSRAVEGLRRITTFIGKASRTGELGDGDTEYRRFATKCAHLTSRCVTEFGLTLSPRQLDSLLLLLSQR